MSHISLIVLILGTKEDCMVKRKDLDENDTNGEEKLDDEIG